MSESSFNLLTSVWLPVRLRSGKLATVAPHQIVGDDPVVALDLPRADFAGAMLEFLIGLLATAYAPDGDGVWADRLFAPPTPETLEAAFCPFVSSFNLDGDGPRFMQDFEQLSAEPKSVAGLLMDQPGEQGLERNTDLFVKGGQVACLSRAAAAMALYTLQTYAPSGGKGYRVSLRGGGPLTTLVDFTAIDPQRLQDTLWTLLWANVPTRATQRPPKDLSAVFPWLGKTRTSEKDGGTTPKDVYELQAFWGMPRRIRLNFRDGAGLACGVLRIADTRMVDGYVPVAYGTRYEGWTHPLSPYYRAKGDKAGFLPRHAQPGGIRYRHWPQLAFSTGDDTSKPAAVVAALQGARGDFLAERLGGRPQAALRTFGYDMDNMKARCWYESRVPVELVADAFRQAFEQRETAAIGFAEEAARALVWAIKCARVDRPKDLKGDFGDIEDMFWQATEDSFKKLQTDLRALVETGETDATARLAQWQKELRAAALRIFDRWTPQPHRIDAMKRVVSARASLFGVLKFDPDAKEKRAARQKKGIDA